MLGCSPRVTRASRSGCGDLRGAAEHVFLGVAVQLDQGLTDPGQRSVGGEGALPPTRARPAAPTRVPLVCVASAAPASTRIITSRGANRNAGRAPSRVPEPT